MVRKYVALALASAFLTICFGCADELNSPITQNEAPVLPPTNVKAFAVNGGLVELTWDASSQPTVIGYNLYRREVGLGSPRKLNPNRIQATEYKDNGTLKKRVYEYRVTAVSEKGKESRFTSVTVQTRDLIEDGYGKVPDPSTGE